MPGKGCGKNKKKKKKKKEKKIQSHNLQFDPQKFEKAGERKHLTI